MRPVGSCLLDAVDYGGPQRSSCGPVSRRVRLGWCSFSVDSGGLEPCRCSRPVRDAAPTITPTIFCSVRPRPSHCSWWACPALTSMCWPWSPPLPTSTNQARCPRSARFRGDRRETGAPGRAERPSKWWAVSLGTLPAGTTEAQVDDMMMVLKVADEATPTPNPA